MWVRQLWKNWGHNRKNPELGPYAFANGFMFLFPLKKQAQEIIDGSFSCVLCETDYTGFRSGGLPSMIWSRSSLNDWEMKAHLWAWGTQWENQDTLMSCLQNWRPIVGRHLLKLKKQIWARAKENITPVTSMDSHFCFHGAWIIIIN